MGLIQSSVEGASSDMAATCGVLSADFSGSAWDQEEPQFMFSEFVDVFEKLD